MDVYCFVSVLVAFSGKPIFSIFSLNILLALLTVEFADNHVMMNLYMMIGTSARLTKKL